MIRPGGENTRSGIGQECSCIATFKCLKQCFIRIALVRSAEFASSIPGRLLDDCLLQPLHNLSGAGYGQFLLAAIASLGPFLKLAQAEGVILATLTLAGIPCVTFLAWKALRRIRRKHER